MLNINKFKTSHKIIIGFGIGVVSLIVMSLVGYFSFGRLYNQSVEILQSRNLDQLITSAELDHVVWSNIVINDINNPEVNRITAQIDPHQCNFGKWYYSQNRQDVEKQAPYLQSYLKDIEDPHARLHQSIETLNEFIARGERENAKEYYRTTVAPIADEIRSTFEKIDVAIEKNTMNDQELVDLTEKSQALMGILGLIFSIVLIGFGILLGQNIISVLKRTINALSTSSTEIAATIEQQERNISQQSASVSQTTSTMEELSVSSRQSTEQTESAAGEAQQVLSLAEEGTNRMIQAQDSAIALKGKVEGIAEQILRLSEQTGQIQNITNLVSDIANQTNLLALNAAVEAARAGEHGRGFAVVATEIRKLADESKRSADKIHTIVSDIHKATNSTVMVTEEGTKKVDEMAQIAQQSTVVLSQITDSANNNFQSVQQISLNVKQQAAAIGQIVDAMSTLNAGAQETITGVSQTKIGVQKINEAAQNLDAMI